MPNRIPPHVLAARERNRTEQLERRESARARLRQKWFMRYEFLNRAAAMILAAMYSSEHIEISLHVPTQDANGRNVRPTRRVNMRHDAVKEATNAYASRRITRSARVLYNVSNSPVQQAENASEINFDTVAVTIMDNSLYVARNFKQRTMPNPQGNGAPLRPAQIYQFGRIPDRTMANIMGILRPALIDSGTNLDFVYFLAPRNAPVSENDVAAPHAEMQLVSYFKGRERELRLGVSKGICPNCQEALRSRGVEFVRTHIHSNIPRNWLPPEAIQVKVESRHRVKI